MKLTIPPGAWSIVPGCVDVVSGWLHPAAAAATQIELMTELTGLLKPHRGFRGFPDPARLTARLGDPGVQYVYGDRHHKLALFGPVMQELRSRVSLTLGTQFNCCYVNLYLNGDAALPRHSDAPQLPQLGPDPVIAAVSFGTSRTFQVWDATAPKDKSRMMQAPLQHGDLCIMHGRSQADWLHGVPRAPGVVDPRLSITFRYHHPVV